jgi:hypothetical protein
VLFLHSTGRLRTDYDIFRNVTGAAEIIRSAEDAPRLIDVALEVCVAQRRPVYLEINKDLWDKTRSSPVGPLKPRVPETNPAALKEVVEDAVQRLQKAKLPVVWSGEELARWGLQRSFQALVEKSKLPYATTLPGKTILPETHPQFVGVYDGRFAPPETREIVGRADCILALGTSICDFIGDLVAKAQHPVAWWFEQPNPIPFMRALKEFRNNLITPGNPDGSRFFTQFVTGTPSMASALKDTQIDGKDGQQILREWIQQGCPIPVTHREVLRRVRSAALARTPPSSGSPWLSSFATEEERALHPRHTVQGMAAVH